MFDLSKKNLLIAVFLISSIALISAYFIEYILGHQPCILCLYERIPFFLAILIILINYKYDVVRDDINDPIVYGIKNL